MPKLEFRRVTIDPLATPPRLCRACRAPLPGGGSCPQCGANPTRVPPGTPPDPRAGGLALGLAVAGLAALVLCFAIPEGAIAPFSPIFARPLLGALAAALLGIGAAVGNRHRRARHAWGWATFARTLGGDLWDEPTRAEIDGRHGGLTVRASTADGELALEPIDTGGRHRRWLTRMTLAVELERGLAVVVTRDTALHRAVLAPAVTRFVGGGDRGNVLAASRSPETTVRTGDPEFDRAILVVASDAALAAGVFTDAALRTRILALADADADPQLWLESAANGGRARLSLRHHGLVLDGERLAAIHEALQAVVAALRRVELIRRSTAA